MPTYECASTSIATIFRMYKKYKRVLYHYFCVWSINRCHYNVLQRYSRHGIVQTECSCWRQNTEPLTVSVGDIWGVHAWVGACLLINNDQAIQGNFIWSKYSYSYTFQPIVMTCCLLPTFAGRCVGRIYKSTSYKGHRRLEMVMGDKS